jgi:hypothetical protein
MTDCDADHPESGAHQHEHHGAGDEHGHGVTAGSDSRYITIALGLIAGFLVFEVVMAFVGHSLALLAAGVGGGAGEAGQDRLGGGGAVPDRGGVLDYLVVVLLDQVPADLAVQGRGQGREPVGRAGGFRAVHPDGANPLDPGQQVDVQQPGNAEPDLGLAVGQHSSGTAIRRPGSRLPCR